MSFYEELQSYRDFDFARRFEAVTDAQICAAIRQPILRAADFLTLLSPQAGAPEHLEAMARLAQKRSRQYFGRTIQLFAPLYVSNYCSNQCSYCGFGRDNDFERRKLDFEALDREAEAIAATGIRHILLLTGEDKRQTPLPYLEETVRRLRRRFSSVSIEIFPMDQPGYEAMAAAGVDGLTVFQETYDEEVYREVHLAGRKRDFRFRLDAPERGAKAGFRSLTLGALLGLGEKRRDFFFTGLHARWLAETYLDTELSISMPRFNPAECGDFRPKYPCDDKSFVQFMLAFRLFMPRAGLTISTRESAAMRDRLMLIGATKLSAGVSTHVGGYSAEAQDTPQFEITDGRSVDEVAAAIRRQGYQPVYKDWDPAI